MLGKCSTLSSAPSFWNFLFRPRLRTATETAVTPPAKGGLTGFPLHAHRDLGPLRSKATGRLTCVGVDMVPKEGDGAESLQAQVAQVRSLVAVNFHVTSES